MNAARALFFLGIVGSALALGALHTPVLLSTTAVFAASAYFSWRDEEPVRARSVTTVMVWLGVLLTLYTALQAVPLPRALVGFLSPYVGEVWSRALAPIGGESPRWIALSLDPSATRIEVLRGATYTACLLAALPLARHREGAVFLERTLMFSALFMATAAIAHPALGAERVFGIYTPVNASGGRHLAPLLNPNHLAAYINIGVCLSLGALLSPHPSVSRLVSGLLVVFFVTIEVWIASRGGTGAMTLAVLLIGVFATRMRTKAKSSSITSAWLLVPLALGSVVVLVGVGSSDAWTELTETDVSKLEIFREAMRVVARAAVFGIGRGAFQSVFPAFRTAEGGNVVFTHPENLVAQWLTEWGVVASVLASAACAVALRPKSMMARSRPPVGAWAALAGAFVHNLVDFNSEVPGVVVALVGCVALVVGGGAGERERFGIQRWSRRPKLVAWSAVAIPVLAALFAIPAYGHELEDEKAEFHRRLLEDPKDGRSFDAALTGAMLRHPAEPYFPYIGGLRAVLMHDESPLPWLAASIERARVNGRAHLVLARAIARMAPAQARFELRLAVEQDPAIGVDAAAEVAPLVTSYEDVLEVAPGETYADHALRRTIATKIADRLPSTASRLDEALEGAKSVGPDALLDLATAAIHDLDDDGSSWCMTDRPACFTKAERLVAKLRAAAPGSCRADAAEAELENASGKRDDALRTLERATNADSDGVTCVPLLVDLATQSSDRGTPEALLERIATAACSSGGPCVETLAALSRVEEAHGQMRSALGFAKRAYQRDSRDEFLVRVAYLTDAMGLHAESLDDYRKLALRHPDQDQWTRAVSRERDMVFSEMTRKAPRSAPEEAGESDAGTP